MQLLAGFARCADSTLYTLNVREVQIVQSRQCSTLSCNSFWLLNLILILGCGGLVLPPLNPDCTSILSCYWGRAIATKMDGVPGPLSGQFTNWPFEGVLGVGDCGIESRQSVVNRNVFSTYATAVEKPG